MQGLIYSNRLISRNDGNTGRSQADSEKHIAFLIIVPIVMVFSSAEFYLLN